MTKIVWWIARNHPRHIGFSPGLVGG